ncbi:MAG: thiol-disulfide isomerase/thioredoxin [Alphaproteobacteria bacterium]
MKIKLCVLFAFITISGMAILYDSWLQPEPSPLNNHLVQNTMPLPMFSVKYLLNNKHINVHAMKEEVILLNFWASWCTICVTEMDELFELVADMNGKVALLTISIDDNELDAQKAYNAFKQRYAEPMNNPHIYWGWDKNKDISLKIFNVQKTPETFIINNKRELVDKIVGAYDWSGIGIRKTLHNMK